jgi:hypothetical protein
MRLSNLFFFSAFVATEFRMVTRELCKIPSFFTTVLFAKIDKDNTGFVTRYLPLDRFGCTGHAKNLNFAS